MRWICSRCSRLRTTDGNGNDKDGFDGTTGNLIDYGLATGEGAVNTQSSYNLYTKGQTSDTYLDQGTQLLAKDTNAYDFDGGVQLAQTNGTDGVATITVTIWLEGWAKLSNNDTTNPQDLSIWSTDYLSKSVEIDMRFACEADA